MLIQGEVRCQHLECLLKNQLQSEFSILRWQVFHHAFNELLWGNDSHANMIGECPPHINAVAWFSNLGNLTQERLASSLTHNYTCIPFDVNVGKYGAWTLTLVHLNPLTFFLCDLYIFHYLDELTFHTVDTYVYCLLVQHTVTVLREILLEVVSECAVIIVSLNSYQGVRTCFEDP